MNRFRQKFRSVDLGPKNDPFILIYPYIYLYPKQEFLSKKGPVTFYCLLNPNFMQKKK